LLIPAYSLVEPQEKLTRQARNRKELRRLLNIELNQLSRTASYTNRIDNIENISELMMESIQNERKRFTHYRQQFLNTVEIIALTTDILIGGAACETTYGLKPQDAVVYSSIISHLSEDQPQVACFLSRNSKDFDTLSITGELKRLNCRMITQFNHGYNFLRSHL